MASPNESNLIKENDKFCEYRYKITEFYILINGEKDELPLERITDFKIEHYFEEAIFPIFKINIMFEKSRYYKMMKNKKDVKFKVRIQSFYKINGAQEESLLKDVINDTFVFFPDDNDSDYDVDVRDEDETREKDDTNELDALNNSMELFLFKEMVTSLRAKCNYILNNVNMSTAVTYMLFKGGAKNVLMSPIENSASYPELVLPPQSHDKQLLYLNNNFGLYKEGGIIYFGLFHSYILNCKAGCTAYFKKEWTENTIYVLEKTNSMVSITGALLRKDEEKYYFIANPDTMSIENTSVSENVVGGVNAKVIDVYSQSVSTNDSNANDVNSKNDKIYFNTTSNPYMGTALAAQQKSNGLTITLSLENINIEAFNPNKKISVIFENQTQNDKYNGVYRIATAIYTFNHDGADYTVNAIVTLKKVG